MDNPTQSAEQNDSAVVKYQRCSFVTVMVPDTPHMISTTFHSEALCATHGMAPNASGLCPIGQIERATEAALAAIAKAVERLP